jgi:hypothetical protein
MPSDVVWTALITATSTGAVGIAGIYGTLRAERSRAAAEDKRDARQHERELRAERRAAYLRFVALYNRLDRYATGYPPEGEDELTATVDAYNEAIVALQIGGDAAVLAALEPIQRLTRLVGDATGAGMMTGLPRAEAFIASWRHNKDALDEAEKALVGAMRADARGVTPGS